VLSIMRILKKHNINVAFRTFNTLGRHLMKAKCKSNDSDTVDKCGVCKLKCGSCPCVYLGQTGRSFRTDYI
jgi:hypothetical protein